MLDLVLSVLASTLIFIVFRLFATYKIQTLYAIITNYFVASICGFIFYTGEIKLTDLPEKNWFWGTFALGILFITTFNLMASSSQKAGVSVTSVATKMSLIIPVLFGIFYLNEHLNVLKTVGIMLALIAVYFATYSKESANVKTNALVLPLLVFLGSGLIDASLKFLQNNYISPVDVPVFSATVFAAAGVTGIVFILIKAFKTPLRINLKNMLAGLVLGVINYCSIFFLLRALQNPSLTSASIFTINNVSIVIFSTLLGIALFKEQITTKNWLGIGLAIFSIILVAL